MGIQGLLPLLRSIHKQSHLRKFAGQTIGIDAYGWLHRGTVACAIELALDRPTTKYVDFAMNRVRMLLDHGITPYLVFDGDALPSKAGTNLERRKRREESKAKGLELYRAKQISQAHQELQKAAAVTPSMAKELIEQLKKAQVQYVVAPYEADAQLVYLEQRGIINGILSEDSDMLVYGARLLLTKLNQYGDCVEIDRADFTMCKEVSLAGFTDAMFRSMAILSGCDYLPSIEKMGLKTAHRYIRKHKDAEKAIRMIQYDNKLSVPADYYLRFQDAELTFIHHRVFCPVAQKMVFMQELSRNMRQEDMPYLGAYVDANLAIGVACGDLNPKTKEPFVGKHSSAPDAKELVRPTTDSETDLKRNKSIDSFFKPSRVPLAELNPNNLTPLPSQRLLLERHRNASWEPRLVASAPQLRRAATSLQSTVSASTNRQDFLARASKVSEYQAPKRVRLCSDAQDPLPRNEVEQSPFFAGAATQPSPLVKKKARNKKTKVASFDVWSDDSVDDVLLGLPDVHRIGTPSKEMSQAATLDATPTPDNDTLDRVPQSSPSKPTTPDALPSQTATQMTECPAPVETQNLLDEELEPFEDLLETHIRMSQNRLADNSLMKTFAYQSPSKQQTALRSISSSIPTNAAFASQKQRPETSSTHRYPAKQRQSFSSAARTFAMQSPERQLVAFSSLSKTGSTQTVRESGPAGKQPAQSLSRMAKAQAEVMGQETSMPVGGSPQAQVNIHYPVLRHIGSEDALIPNSEDEGSEVDTEEQLPTLDLRRFAYKS